MAKKEVMKDWLDRDDDYVYRGGYRSGWDDEHKSTSNYVLSGFVKPDNTEAELHEIYKLCKNRSQILSGDLDIKFTFNPKESTARTDGKKVIVGTGVLSEASKDFNKKADIMLGLTTHEMAHVLFSTFAHLKKVDDNFHKSILNVIEDERIEYLMCDEFPGYANNIAETKQYFFDDKYLVEEASKSTAYSEEERYALELFDVFFKLVRYPKYLTEELLDKFEMELDEIKAVLNPYPKTAIAAFNASKEIRNLFKKNVSKKTEELRKAASATPSESKPSEEELEAKSEETSSEGEGSGGKGSPTSSESIEEALKKIEDKIAEMMKDFMSDNDSDKIVEVCEDVKRVDFTKELIYDGKNRAIFRTGEPNTVMYSEYLDEVKADTAKLAGSLFTRVFSESSTLRGLRSGSLDESKIVEAANGAKNVHIKTNPKQVKSVNIAMLIDESGSMAHNQSYKDAAKAAILIERTFETFPLGQLFIYGFTADATWKGTEDYNQIIRYREPGLNVKYGLGSIKPRFNNRDGHAIRAVVNRIRSFSNEPMLFFIISDGVPSANRYSGYDDTRAAVLEATKKKFFPIQIGIGPGIKPEKQRLMFDDFIHYETSTQMVNDLRKLVIRKSQRIFGL